MTGAAVLLIAALAACGSDSSSDTSGDSGGEYRVGAAMGQTGGLAYVDQPLIKGFEYALEEINAEGGIDGKWKMVLDVQDTRSDNAEAAIAAQRLISEGNQFIMLASDSDAGIAGGQVAQRAKIPALSAGASPTMTLTVGDYMFSGNMGQQYETTAVAEFAKREGAKTAYTIGSNESLYTQAIPEFFTEVFEKVGGKIVGNSSVALEQADFSAVITRIQGLNPPPDVITTPLYEPAFPAFIKQLRQAGLDLPVYGYQGIQSPNVYSLGPAVKGVIVPSAAFATPGSELAKFYETMTEKHGEETANAYAAIGYNNAKVIAAGVTKAGSTDPEKVRDALASLKDVEGTLWPISYGPDRSQRFPIHMLELQGDPSGSQEDLGTTEPNEANVPKVTAEATG